MKIFKSETLGEQLDREAKEREELKKKFKREKEQNEKGGLVWNVANSNYKDQNRIIIEQNECIIQLLTILCSGQNKISGTAAVIAINMYKDRLKEIEKS